MVIEEGFGAKDCRVAYARIAFMCARQLPTPVLLFNSSCNSVSGWYYREYEAQVPLASLLATAVSCRVATFH